MATASTELQRHVQGMQASWQLHPSSHPSLTSRRNIAGRSLAPSQPLGPASRGATRQKSFQHTWNRPLSRSSKAASILQSLWLASVLVLATPVALAQSRTFTYGRHFPQGTAAVNHLTGPSGTWKHNTPAEYKWNFYSQMATVNHRFDESALITYADGSHSTTCRDINGHLLLDFNHDREIDVADGGFAFCEHNGIGRGGRQAGPPFTNFWFDDNWLARYMTAAYALPAPNGLSQYTDFTRWRIVGGDRSSWTPYSDSNFDQLALNGLYYIAANNVGTAFAQWNTMLGNSGYAYDGATQRYLYPRLTDTYYLGLWRVLTENLRDSSGLSADQYRTLLQHSVSLRSNILSLQQQDASGKLLGWLSSTVDGNALINTETVASCVLGVGANAKYTFEAGRSPLSANPNNYFLRPHNVLSAVFGLSAPGFLTYGPYWTFPVGTYQVEFYLRAPAPTGKMATLEVRDASSGASLAFQDVQSSALSGGNTWTCITLTANVVNAANKIELRTFWEGSASMDVAYIRVR